MNALNTLLSETDSVLGVFLSETASPNLLRVLKAGGLDFVVVDCEHGCFDFSQVSALAAVGNGIGFPVIVRLPLLSREHIQKYLDCGADGLILPMTDTVHMAKELVRFSKFPPIGQRGVSVTRPHSEYNPGKLSDYFKKANDRTMILVQIETDTGVQNAEAIAGLEGIDVVLVGPNDLAVSYGVPGDFHHEKVQKALNHVVAAAEKAHKPSGIISSSMPFLKECRELGMRVFSCNSEVGILQSGIKSMRKDFFE